MGNKFKNIILAGMPGSGKTTVACNLNLKLKDFTLIDTDKEIETHEQMSITEIFKTQGEQYFRKLENNLIKSLSDNLNLIIATGGGAFENKENIINLKKNGIIFFLDCSNSVLYERIKEQTQRPLLQIKDLKQELSKIKEKRIANFLLADNIVNAERSVSEITQKVLELYNEQQY